MISNRFDKIERVSFFLLVLACLCMLTIMTWYFRVELFGPVKTYSHTAIELEFNRGMREYEVWPGSVEFKKKHNTK